MFSFLFFPLRLVALVAAGFALAVALKLGMNVLSMMSGRSDLAWPRKTDADSTLDGDEPLWKRRFPRSSDDQ
jgi:hypothetical protein